MKQVSFLFAAPLFVLASVPTIFVGSTAKAAQPLLPRALGSIPVNKPAFLSLSQLEENSDTALVISSFNPFGSDSVSQIPDIGSALTSLSTTKSELLSSDIIWPNGITQVPKSIFGFPGMLVSGGFLVPGKSTGAVTLLNPENGATHVLSHPKNGFFYHRSFLLDMNNDGKLDVLTARANKPIIGASKGELLWLEQPNEKPLENSWKEHVLNKSSDVHFDLVDLNNDGQVEIVSAEFFAKKLSISWKNGDKFESRVIDSKLGSAFDIQIVDVNNDGKHELLVTNHENKALASAVFAFEIPVDFKTGEFTRHTLLTGIETRQKGLNQGSPGSAFAFHPSKALAAKKPYILVSGDGSQRAHLITPRNESPTDWTYDEHVVVDEKATVGQSVVGDVNNDGFMEIFVPAYDKNRISVFTFAP